jgi:ergothioneine biosynthesis protein EgtB
MPDASPTKWHLGHTTWFFEAFVLAKYLSGYRLFDDRFAFCFNSYYEHAGRRQPRAHRGLMTRPSHSEVVNYRSYVDEHLERLVAGGSLQEDAAHLIELGINHEEQHQELLLMDILNVFASGPLKPAYRAPERVGIALPTPGLTWSEFQGGITMIGHDGSCFAFDNEGPQHSVLLQPFRLANRLVTNGEWLEFIEDGGYRDFRHWLSDGWTRVQSEGWSAPGYWTEADGTWFQMTLEGPLRVVPAAPVCNISYFEADAFARWSGKRLPTEFEWEASSHRSNTSGNTLGSDALRPRPAPAAATSELTQMFGDVWEWTQSAYLPYPGFKTAAGAVGEYNGKFMVSQHVLRGAACITPCGHSRRSYRNFFYPHQRWQFAGVRLAEDV